MAENSESIKIDEKQRIFGDKLKPVNDEGELSFVAGFQPLVPKQFSYSSAVELNVTGMTPTEVFSPGDYLRIVQNSTTKYFQVLAPTSDSILITWDDTYNLTNDQITSIELCKFTYNLAQTDNFQWRESVTITASAGNFTPSSSPAYLNYRILGNYMYIGGSILGAVSSTPATISMEFDHLPVIIATSSGKFPIVAVDNTATIIATGTLATITSGLDGLRLAKTSGNWATSAGSNTSFEFAVILAVTWN